MAAGIPPSTSTNRRPAKGSARSGSAASITSNKGVETAGIPPRTSTTRHPAMGSTRKESAAQPALLAGADTSSISDRVRLARFASSRFASTRAAHLGLAASGSNSIAARTRASWPPSTTMSATWPRSSCGVSASRVYEPGSSPSKRYIPLLVVVVRASAPVTWLRTTTVAPSIGLECRSVSRPLSEPAEPFWMDGIGDDWARTDWANISVPAPVRSTANVSGFVQLRPPPAIETPARGRSWEKLPLATISARS